VQLKQLRTLQLQGNWKRDIEEELLQLLAQPLPLQQLHLTLKDEHEWKLQLAHLTQLQQLCSNIVLSRGSVLPKQLQHLTLYCCFRGLKTVPATVLDLKQLQQLELVVGFKDPRLLLQLAALPALQNIALVYEQAKDAVATASAWGQLPQLRELSLYLLNLNVSVEVLQAMIASAAAAAGLTRLGLCVNLRPSAGTDMQLAGVGAVVCDSLARLASLQHLDICGSNLLAPSDALALTALTRLTHLELGALRDDIDRTVVVALADSLKQLRYLRLPSVCYAGRAEIQAAAAELTQLTELSVRSRFTIGCTI
jgi:hypothetical protein